MLERLGVNSRDSNLKTKNVAAVMVTATLPPFARQGSRIDVTVSALGDAKSLLGGTLLVTPMLGADNEIYAVAQGQVAIGGFKAGGAAQKVSQGVATAGRVANGAIVERETGFDMSQMATVRIALRNPDLTTGRRMSQAINSFLHQQLAQPLDPTTVVLQVPANRRGDAVGLLTDIEQLQIEPDQPARIVIDEARGVIVMGQNVRISTVAVAQGNLTVRVTETPEVSQPSGTGIDPTTGQPIGGGGGQTVVVPRTQVDVDQGSKNRLAIVPNGVTLQQLVGSLNALGVGPRDLITILQAIKAAGALQADIEVI